jgi:hypothetical protein
MDERTATAIKADFEEWSGGTPPDSEEQIFIYVEFARPAESNGAEVTQLLREWMVKEWTAENESQGVASS